MIESLVSRRLQAILAFPRLIFVDKVVGYVNFLSYLCIMNEDGKIRAYKNYFADFINSIDEGAVKKIRYVLDMLKSQERLSIKFVKFLRDGLFEIRAEHSGNIYRVFFIFDEGNIVILFNGFQKKSQKTPENEIEKALILKKEYYAAKRNR